MPLGHLCCLICSRQTSSFGKSLSNWLRVYRSSFGMVCLRFMAFHHHPQYAIYSTCCQGIITREGGLTRNFGRLPTYPKTGSSGHYSPGQQWGRGGERAVEVNRPSNGRGKTPCTRARPHRLKNARSLG